MKYKLKLILVSLIGISLVFGGVGFYISNLESNSAKAAVTNLQLPTVDSNQSGLRQAQVIPDQYILKLKPGVDSQSLDLKNTQNEKLEIKQKLDEQTFLVQNPTNNLNNKSLSELSKAEDQGDVEVKNETKQTQDTVKELSKNENVEAVEANAIIKLESVPNDPFFGTQWHHQNTGQSGGTTGKDIKTAQAFDISQGSSSVVVAIIDSGADLTHPDLVNNIYKNSSNQVIGYDFANSDNDPTDDNGHGTHVAGTVAASGNNNLGVTGVCPSCKILPIKFMDATGNGTTANGINSINFAVANGAKVLNLSWGSNGYSASLQAAINNAYAAGVTVVAASGNENVTDYQFPADMNHVISVAATDRNDARAYFSNYNDRITVSAPGVEILSTFPPGVNKSGVCGDSNFAPNNDGYGYCTGTSMASPVVAGVAALIKSQFPTYTPDQIAAKIITTSDNINAQNPNYVGLLGSGRVNAFRALSEPLIPSFSFAKADVADPLANNNSLAEPGEQISFTPSILNLGAYTTGVSGVLSTSSSGVVITQASGNFNNLNFAQTQSATFNLTLNPNLVLPQTINFSLVLSSIGFSSQNVNFSYTFKPAVDLPSSYNFSLNNQDWTPTGIWKLSDSCFTGTTLGTPKYFHLGKDNCGDYDFNFRINDSLYSPPIKAQNNQVSMSFDQFLETENASNQYDKATVKIKVYGALDSTAITIIAPQSNTPNWINTQVNLPLNITQAGLFQIIFNFDSIDGATNNYRGWYIDNVNLSAATVSASSSILLIDPNKITFDPIESSAVKFGSQDLTLNMGGGLNDDARFTANSSTSTCKFKLKAYGSLDNDTIKGFDPITLKLLAATTGGIYNSASKTFDVPYTSGTGCNVKIPAANQNQPKWFFDIQVVRSDGQIFERSNSYFQAYGAIGAVAISA
ncbi:MAG: S8 family peptidase [bacterium]